jgi:hypothetical protein
MNLSEAGRARGLPKHDPKNALGFWKETSFHVTDPRQLSFPFCADQCNRPSQRRPTRHRRGAPMFGVGVNAV